MLDNDLGTPKTPVITVSNLFGDVNRGGAAITARTIEVALGLGPDVAGVSIDDADPGQSHPHTTASFPDVPILRAPLTVKEGPLRGLRMVAKSLSFLANPNSARLPAALKRVAASDVVISKGGYVFVDRDGLRPLMRMWATVYPLVFARRVGVPVVAFPTSVSPQRHFLSKLLNRWLLTNMAAFFPRDPLSADVARSLGVRKNRLFEVPDIVLGMSPPSAEHVHRLCAEYEVTSGRFGVMAVQLKGRSARRQDELETMARVAKGLVEDGVLDKVLIVDQAGDGKDSADLAELIGDAARLVLDNRSPADLVALYAGAEIVISCRLHAAIFSLVGGTPAIAISVTPLKAEGVYASVGLPAEWVIPIEEIDRLQDVTRALLSDRDPARDEILTKVSRTAAELNLLPEVLRGVLGQRQLPEPPKQRAVG